MSGEILFLAHRIPFPPDRGDKIRSHHIVKALAELAPVHIGCLAENEADFREERNLTALAASHCLVKRSKLLPIAGIEALIKSQPISFTAFGEAALHEWVKSTLEQRPITAIYVYSGQMGQYIPDDWEGRLVVDLVDVDSAKFEAYSQWKSPPASWIYRREGKLVRQIERDLVSRADCSLLVSADEAKLMQERAKEDGLEGSVDIRALSNGIDCDAFDPLFVAGHPELAETEGPHFVFSGQMDYAPNIEAVRRFSCEIMPRILEREAQAKFHIVGRAPTEAVKKLAESPGTRVWGAVPDMRPFIAAADLIVAPLTIARGVQNKVLEAMAMGKVVLVSPEAATGIAADHDEHFVICSDNDAFVEAALEVLANPIDLQVIGKSAREFVQDQMSWPAMLADLPEIMGVLGEEHSNGKFDLENVDSRNDAA